MRKPKVFGIGFHKTGTTSLKTALEQLGYHVTGPDGVYEPNIEAKLDRLVKDLAKKFDAFQDNPWPLVYEQMDALYPGSKFVLTTRDSDDWIASATRHFGTDPTPMRTLIYGAGYGSPVGNEAHYVTRMEAHNAAVRAYFKTRPDQLLEMSVTNGFTWLPLCDFLGHPVPDTPFPHQNAAQSRENAVHRAHETAAGRTPGLRGILRAVLKRVRG